MSLRSSITNGLLPLAVASCVLAAAQGAAAQDVAPSGPPPALKQILDNTGNLSLAPQAVSPREELKFEPEESPRPSLAVMRVTQWSTPSAPGSSLFNGLEKVFDAQDTYWPMGTQSSVHIQPMTDDGIGRWVPFVSLSQDADEVDAHVRNGIGAGATYRFTPHARVDVEGMFLQHNGDENPALRDESRAMVVFSMDF